MIPHLSKHLISAGGRYSKFLTDSAVELNNLLAKALSIAGDFIINSDDSFCVLVDMGEEIGTRGETIIKMFSLLQGK